MRGSPKGSHGRGPMGEGTLGSPKGSHGRESRTPHGRGTLGSPRDPMGGYSSDPPLGAHLKVICDEATFKKLRQSRKSSFLMFSKTRFGETSRERCLWSVRSSWTPLNPPNFNLDYSLPTFYRISSFSNFYRIFVHLPGLQRLFSQVSYVYKSIWVG